jgi:hypothetical protein
VNQAWGQFGISGIVHQDAALYNSSTPGIIGYAPSAPCVAQPGSLFADTATVEEMNRYRAVDLGDAYVAHFYWKQNSWQIQLSHDGTFVAETTTRSHIWAARWARRQMKKHRKAMQILRGDA